jgi:[CysO sulfur-carrier protein]-S-L-cysteine hydrolase
MVTLHRNHLADIVAHARAAGDQECCGLIGGTIDGRSQSVYRLRNIAADPLVTYEAAPEDLFAAQRRMREREEQLIAIYHSHPRAVDPTPSETDVRLAYYPSATYLIVGLAGPEPVLRAFQLLASEHRWQAVEYGVSDA